MIVNDTQPRSLALIFRLNAYNRTSGQVICCQAHVIVTGLYQRDRQLTILKVQVSRLAVS